MKGVPPEMVVAAQGVLISVEEAAGRLRDGKIVIVVDDLGREHEGDLVMAGARVSADGINFMARYGRGLICATMTNARCDHLDLPLMVARNTSALSTNFCVSVDGRHGTSTGISAADRAETISVLVDESSVPHDLLRPGHIFPLRAVDGGVLERPGHTEASVDLARIAGLAPLAVICEVMDDDGSMARLPRLIEFAREHGLGLLSVADVLAHRLRTECLVEEMASPKLPTAEGDFRIHAFRSTISGEEHIALVHGDLRGDEPVLVRVHSQCLTGDVLGSARCDCGQQLVLAKQRILEAGRGVVVYLLQEGRGIGLVNKLRAYELQDSGQDTVDANHVLGFPADQRTYGAAAQVLRSLGVSKLRLMTNNPAKVDALTDLGLEVTERLAHEVEPTASTRAYLKAKKQKLGHLLSLV